jgi:hypothetical protein
MVDRAQTSPAFRSEKVTPATAVTAAVRYQPPTADLYLQHPLAAQDTAVRQRKGNRRLSDIQAAPGLPGKWGVKGRPSTNLSQYHQRCVCGGGGCNHAQAKLWCAQALREVHQPLCTGPGPEAPACGASHFSKARGGTLGVWTWIASRHYSSVRGPLSEE